LRLNKLFIFGNIYISICAVVMCLYAFYTFNVEPDIIYLLFVFFATMTSYSFHWYLTPDVSETSMRFKWVIENRKLLQYFFLLSISATSVLLFILRDYFLILAITALFTFIYSAAKISRKPFIWLRKIVIRKTAYLAGIWTLVSVILPMIISKVEFSNSAVIFTINRFLLIYVICILFDHRDKEEDKRNGVKNLIGQMSIGSIRILYFLCLGLFFISSIMLFTRELDLIEFLILIIPGILLCFSFGHSISTRSDYWYYFYLDGLMMLSGFLYLLKMLFP